MSAWVWALVGMAVGVVGTLVALWEYLVWLDQKR